MRVLMIGRGTIATIYGSVFHAAGYHVEYLVRPGRAAEYGDDVQLDLIDGRRGPFGKRTRTTLPTTLRESIGPKDRYDVVVVSVGHHHLQQAAKLLAPVVGEATVLVLGNVWDEPLEAVAPLPADRVVFGFPAAGGGFGADGVLHGALLPSLIVGASASTPTPSERTAVAALRGAGLSVRTEPDMRGWLFIHFISDAGMFAQAMRSGGMTRMVGNRRAFRDAFRTSRELLPMLTARGVNLKHHRGALLPLRAPGVVAAISAIASALLPILQVSLVAHGDPMATEPQAVLGDVNIAARRLNLVTPLFDNRTPE
jgi:2-dehydropantoate 2-reductase